jgi:hypothetical protein
MKLRLFLGQLGNGLIWLVAIGWAAWLYVDPFDPYLPEGQKLLLLPIALALVALGDIFEFDLRGGRSTPASNAIIFPLFVVLEPVEVLLVIIPTFLFAMIVRAQKLGYLPRFRSTSRRLAATLVALGVYIQLVKLVPQFQGEQGDLLSKTLAMVVAGVVQFGIDTGLWAGFIARAEGVPAMPILQSQLQKLAPLQIAFLSVAALISLAYGALGIWAFVLFLPPLFAARHAFRRYASIHRTYEQTIKALSKAPELAGYAHEGHSARVADLAVSIARQQGLSEDAVEEIEFAALLHDVGRFSFDDPAQVPESMAGTPGAARLAEASAAIVGQTKYLARVAEHVRDQDLPLSGDRQPQLGSRIVKVANDYVELTKEGPGISPLLALHQMEVQAGSVYDPALVRSLRRTLEHRGAV